MEYTELFDGIDELLESGELIVSDGKLYSAVDELDEGIIGGLIQKVQAHKDRKAQTALSREALKGENASEKDKARADKARAHMEKLTFSGKDKSVSRASNIVKSVNKTADNVAKLNKAQDTFNNNAAAIRKSLKNTAANNQKGNDDLADAKYRATNSATYTKVGKDGKVTKKTVKGLGVNNNNKSAESKEDFAQHVDAVAESVLVFNMPETLMLAESDNYEYFLEQVLAYNGFKVTENNVNVLHAALENGHAVIE